MRAARLILIAVLALLTAACAVAPTPSDRFYRLELPQAAASKLPIDRVVVVNAFEAYGAVAERALLYREEGSPALTQYHYHLWAEPPAQMLSDALARHLRVLLGEERVYTRSARARADLVVRPRLRKLEQVLGEGGARAELALQFVVSEPGNQPLFVLEFDQSEAAASAAPEDYVVAIDKLIGRAYNELGQRLTAELPVPSSTP